MKVMVPGAMTAVIENGRIAKYVFIPHAANAGYFEDPIFVDKGEIDPETFFNMVSRTLLHGDDASRFVCEWES